MTRPEFFYQLDFPSWKEKLLYWTQEQFELVAYTTGNAYSYPHSCFEEMLYLGKTILTETELWHTPVFKVGILGYDFKNQIENLESLNPAFFPLPEHCFFSPEWILRIESNGFYSSKEFPKDWLTQIKSQIVPKSPPTFCDISAQIDRESYIRHIEAIQYEIREGNTYEANFCQAFSGSFVEWDPVAAFLRLNQLSPMPFAALFKAGSKWLVSASPERFIKKSGDQLIAQPIKGTIRRGNTPESDLENRNRLLASEKERAENLMITDLMRNDLARVSQTGSVAVEELFGIYALPRVFQMISTVTSTLNPNTSLHEIIQATFPMGSMTGAPKISTMGILDREESFRRAWFSGAFGWIDENGDFDFSVVIRSIIADLEEKKLYFGVGSAITIDASAEQEFEECALKAQAIIELLRGK